MMMRTEVQLLRYKRRGIVINFIPQGGYELTISGDLSKFEIQSTSHLKSDTFIECSGGVKIGKYFHVARGLTIFSSVHPYKTAKKIPYDDVVTYHPVIIGDFVWVGANVTILPGVEIGEGAIVGASSVVTKNVPALAIVAGNPAKMIGQRDCSSFDLMKKNQLFH